jgi:hypothetical protein
MDGQVAILDIATADSSRKLGRLIVSTILKLVWTRTRSPPAYAAFRRK